MLLDCGNRVAFGALTCGSWSCPHCRRVNAARTLDRIRRGMESRQEWQRTFLTLTIDPAKFGAVQIGWAGWDQHGNRVPMHKAVRKTRLWSPPTADQFKKAVSAMSREWNKLNARIGRKAQREETERPEFFRIIELHRNLWPHYHVVIEHPEWSKENIERQVNGWNLGRVDLRSISLDDAVAELAPYLVNKEGQGKGYQFAGLALPKGFRVYSASRSFLAPVELAEYAQEVISSMPLKGHFFSHHQAAQEWGADSRILLNPPPDDPEGRHKPPGTALATGDGARLYYLAYFEHSARISPEAEKVYRESIARQGPPKAGP